MHKLLLSGMLIIAAGAVSAQSSKAVQWSFSSKKLSDQLYEVHLDATIEGNWHIYSQNGGDGPFSTLFTFNKNPLVAADGKVQEVGSMKKIFEQAFGSEVRFYEKSVSFVQKVKVRGKAKTNLAGKVEF
ncbi:MAG: hypothetical protein ABI687_13090, partial [Flavitalea sp.]